jgi:alkaline phosphatase D
MKLRNRSIPDPTEQNRRQFLRRTGAASVAAVVGLSGQESTAMTDDGEFESDPFSLGVASGDPLPDSVILWTRLAPDPLTVGGGMPSKLVDVRWTVATDKTFQRVVGSSTAAAKPEHAHTVHVEASGLDPGTEYYYRFEAGGVQSPIGQLLSRGLCRGVSASTRGLCPLARPAELRSALSSPAYSLRASGQSEALAL